MLELTKDQVLEKGIEINGNFKYSYFKDKVKAL